MIIPVRCFTCGRVLADKWDAYVRIVEEVTQQQKAQSSSAGGGAPAEEGGAPRAPPLQPQQTPQAVALERLGIRQLCCRTVMLSTVDMLAEI